MSSDRGRPVEALIPPYDHPHRMPTEYYKVVTYIPPEFLDEMMDRINRSMEPLYDSYDYVFSFWPVEGRWRPLEGAAPYQGMIGSIEEGREIRLETTAKAKDVREVVMAIKAVHPYEEPVIDLFPVIPYRLLLDQ
jgi:hypothetical protein